MNASGWIQLLIFCIGLALITKPMGIYLIRVLDPEIEGGMGICETAPPHFEGTLPLARLFRDIAGTTLLDAPADFPEAIIAASL